ncbi:MAG TPA: condensation domain-containing protein, partial [Blastocatellia bacterium]|nr:condensation domain-containing protein [Blastocatellia bacterium]
MMTDQEAWGIELVKVSQVDRQLHYWRAALKELPEQLDLPTDRPRPSALHNGGRVQFRLKAGLHQRLLALAEAVGADLFMALQAGVAALLARLGAGTDIPIGSRTAGQARASREATPDHSMNLLVLRTDVSGNPGFRELLERVREVDLQAYAHADVPFVRLVEELDSAPSPARHPLCQVTLALQCEPSAEAGHSILSRTPQPAGILFDLAFNLCQRRAVDGEPGELDGQIEYAADLFDRATVEAMAERLERLLEAVAEDAEAPIGQINLFAPEERRQILEDWNDTLRTVPGATLPELFEAQAARYPDATAVVFDDQSLSYAELNERANQLAHLLMG